jgi:NAD(P)-dependent dehydrogenase (short-subunit alcohol dehydrogenase family)
MAMEARAALYDPGAIQLAGIMHAGGVLQDGLLFKQTAGSVRYVWSPKLCFMAHAVFAVPQQALHVVSLFSSVSAFLGTPGQSNYAAANSALNAWADILQQRGIGGKCLPVHLRFVAITYHKEALHVSCFE